MSKSKVRCGSMLRGSLVAVLLGLAAAPAGATILFGRSPLPPPPANSSPICSVTISGTTYTGGSNLSNSGDDPCSYLSNTLACTFDTSQASPPNGVCLPIARQMYFNYTWDRR